MTPRLLFFFTQTQFCLNYYNRYLAKYRQWVRLLNLTKRVPEELTLARKYSVDTVPTLILVERDGVTPIATWRSGKPPNMNYINVEIGMSNAFPERPKQD
jgi:hypothetical protein